MKKILILLLTLTLILSGCQKKEENECEESQESTTIKYVDKSVITINKEKKTAQDIIDLYTKSNYGILFYNIESELLKKELPEELEAAEKSANETMEELESYYSDSLLDAIKNYTTYSTLEEYKESLIINYLYNKYINNYIEENKINISINQNIKEDDLESYYIYALSVDAIRDLFNKYEVKFEDKALKETHEKYLEDINKYYLEQINSLENE